MAIVESARPDFGGRVRRLREERGVSLRQIADATKISVGALEALERNDLSRLPGGIFSRGYVRSYATQVGLDPEQTVRDFLVQFPHDSVTAGSQHAAQDGNRMAARRSRSGATFVAVVVTVTVIVGAILFMILTS